MGKIIVIGLMIVIAISIAIKWVKASKKIQTGNGAGGPGKKEGKENDDNQTT